MRRVAYLLVIPVVALGMVAGLSAANPPLALAPPIETPYADPPELPPIESIEQLYQMRDRLQADLEQSSVFPDGDEAGIFSPPTEMLQTLQAVEIRIQVEEAAKQNWDQAIRLATQAVAAQQQSNGSLESAEKVYSLWNDAVSSLRSVPEQSFRSEDANAKAEEYENYLKFASYNYDTARSGYLEPIAEKTGLSADRVHITVCHVASRECRRLNGSAPPASPASLIKVPVAIAVMEKVTSENIDLDTPISISRGNYTEDASDVWVGSEYPLRQVLLRMIEHSSNIATNQLIDYVGRDRINQILSDRGYEVTRVNTKLVGEHTYPANAGVGPNQINTDELTEMMVAIYNREHPGDDELIKTLMSQDDLVLGHQGLRNSKAFWMGEKTGQNSKALGTTVAFMLDDEYYVVSVVLDYSGNERAIRETVNAIANHIDQNGL
jgi:beta-lactamase class A